jgi:hypothetical protein
MSCPKGSLGLTGSSASYRKTNTFILALPWRILEVDTFHPPLIKEHAMSWSYLALGAIVVLVILMVIFRKNPIVKLYWKYTLILIPLAVLIVLKIINDLKGKPASTGPAPTTPDPLATKIQDIKESLVEAQMTSAVEISAAKAKNNETLKKLEEVVKIPDKVERRKQLAAMIG